ncbi:hypothetical protein XM38_026400 [Halomicronema hongdechloris C2206]|uniref:Uncharacterized protein n=1 Tax=Halomicronema hongdechloris C2206 TaxID=1641165 RepID=A0A1Z3HN47_9CYAN|nr:hypothetical protein [Halomicronema hongdechloris]ASC71686.1 hypothetical protein XM38_026400 [Halomicronema hongdechloris C2206]
MHSTSYLQREILERLYHQSPSRFRYGLSRWTQALATAVVEWLTRDRNAPRIYQRHDAAGNVVWQAYDPLTRRSIMSQSEQEIRAWLEERYAHQPDV